MESPTVATYPSAGGRGGIKKCVFSWRKCVESPPTFIWGKTLEKPKRGLWNLRKRVRELFTYEKGISTPRTRHKEQQPLIECAKHDFEIMCFPFLCFFIFLGRQGCCPCSYVSSSAMRNSDLHSSLSLKVCVLNWFFFWKIYFYCEQRSFKALDLETMFYILKIGESR